MARLPPLPGAEVQLPYEEQEEDGEEVLEVSRREEAPGRADVGASEISTDQPVDWLEGCIALRQLALAPRLVRFIQSHWSQ